MQCVCYYSWFESLVQCVGRSSSFSFTEGLGPISVPIRYTVDSTNHAMPTIQKEYHRTEWENSHNDNNKKILHHSNMIMCCRTVYLRLDLELRERCSRAYLLKHTECSISIDQINIEWQAGYVWSHSEGGREGPAITAHYPHITIPMWVWCLRRGVLIKLCLPEWQQRWRGRQQSNWGRDCVASPGWSPCGTGSASQSSKCTDLCKGKKE